MAERELPIEDLLGFMDDDERARWYSGTEEERSDLRNELTPLWFAVPDPTEAELERVMGPDNWTNCQRGHNREGIRSFYIRKWKRDRKAEARKRLAESDSDSGEPTNDEIRESMRPAARHAYDNPETTREERSRIWQAAKKRLLKSRSKRTQPPTPLDENDNEPPPDRWLMFGRNAHGEPELQPYPPPESDEDRRLRERREILLREERLETEKRLAERKRELDEIMRPPSTQKRPDEIIREDGYTDKEVRESFERRYLPKTVLLHAPPEVHRDTIWQKLGKLADSNLFWSGGVGMALVALGFEWAKAPPKLTIAMLALAWLVVCISTYRHKFFEGSRSWVAWVCNIIVWIGFGGVLALLWLLFRPQ